jgi:arylsulfatase A-like enzyme
MRQQAPNIFLIVSDSLRADHLSCYGYHRRTTPQLDALAEEATVYAAAVSPGVWAPPSHASIFTGTSPSRHRVDRGHPELDSTFTTLPEYLRTRGYRTFGISSSYWIGTTTKFDRGFDVFAHSWQLLQARSNPSLQRQRRRDPSYCGDGDGDSRPVEWLRTATNQVEAAFRRYCRRPLAADDKGARRVNRTVERWARQWAQTDEPIFAYIHYTEPHLPYRAPGRFLRQHLGDRAERRARQVNQHPLKFMSGRVRMDADDFEVLGRLYDAEVSYTDHCIGEVLGALRRAHLLDRSLVIVTGSHGENLGDHGLMDHMFSVHESVVRVPLIVRYPWGRNRGVVSELVQTHDIFPTVVALTSDTDNPDVGTDLRQQLEGGPLPPFGSGRDYAVTELLQVQPPIETLARRYPKFDWSVYNRSLRAVRTATHKYVRTGTGDEALYCLVNDPAERSNRTAAEPERTAELRTWLDNWEGSIAPKTTVEGAVT